MARGMVRRKRNLPVVNYIQKNVCSIISVNCLLDLTLLPYFKNILAVLCGCTPHCISDSEKPLILVMSQILETRLFAGCTRWTEI